MRTKIRWVSVIAGRLFQIALAKLTRARRGLYLILPTGGALLGLALVGGFIPPWHQRQISAAEISQLTVEGVTVVSPQLLMPRRGLDLPAEVKPWQEASIYSRVDGYLKGWYVDNGARVKQAQLLAEIDTPDLDHQLDQARSQATVAKASAELARTTNEKWQRLFREGAVSKLDADNTATNENTTAANQQSYEEKIRVLEEEISFKHITAPFPGVVTSRHTNVGDLIVANNVSNEMFHIQQIDPLRIYFRLPQGKAAGVKVDQPIDVVFSEPVNKTMQAKVATTSESVASNSRTLLVELHMANPNGEIPPGSYAEVHLPTSTLETPRFNGHDAGSATEHAPKN
jgi:membrane fusion protein (multidrug efflux system)